MHLKRGIDIAASLVILIVASPVFALVGFAVYLRLGRPVLFRQVRPGLQGQPFTLLKFRTMTDGLDDHGVPLSDEQRLTPLGRLLRRTSLDELPELWNVLKGEMSLVGPRPLLLTYIDRFTPEQGRRHEVKPGLTGLAQVGGRNSLTWDKKLELDVWYVDHQSLWLDLIIILRTVWHVMTGAGVSAEGHITMPEFRGSND